MKTKHRMIQAPVYVPTDTGKAIPYSGATAGGNIETGGYGQAGCSCGWYSEYGYKTRQERRGAFKEHKLANEHPGIQPDWKTRNDHILYLANNAQDSIEVGTKEIPIFMTVEESFLYKALPVRVIKDLIACYRKNY